MQEAESHQARLARGLSGFPQSRGICQFVKVIAQQEARFKRFKVAAVTIAGIELLHRVRKGQFNLRGLRLNGEGAPAIWNAVLAA